MSRGFEAIKTVTIDAPKDRVWNALTDPKMVKQYMHGTNMSTDWKEGSPIKWKGEWKGKAYQDKGVIKRVNPQRLLQYTHFSPLTGEPDKPENYHTVTVELSEDLGGTRVVLSQDNNAGEEARGHSETNWKMMLEGLKKLLEK